ncbi:MAG: peptidoglycan-binding protein [Acidimicrobiia bacterium]
MVGDEVAVLQQRLIDLAFDPGPVDGYFGHATRRAVWTFEKLIMSTPRDEVTGIVTGAVWDTMLAATAAEPRRPGEGDRHTEIYLPEQVLAVFHAGHPVLVSHMSSGAGDEWCEIVTIDVDERGRKLDEVTERDVCGISTTPGGVFEYFRRIEGVRNGALGSMWNPVYFNYGIAVHGAIDVPLRPASHGCVRIPMHISDYFQTLVTNGDRVLVWNGDKEPEQLSEREMLPVFDYPNPNSTTTTENANTTTPNTSTSSTTSTTAPPTPAPAPATSTAPSPSTPAPTTSQA